jgi:transcriptional regulator with XRE-family HTH domain
MTQRELAQELGVAWNTVARYERDEIGIPEPVARLVMLLQRKRKE